MRILLPVPGTTAAKSLRRLAAKWRASARKHDAEAAAFREQARKAREEAEELAEVFLKHAEFCDAHSALALRNANHFDRLGKAREGQ